MRPPTSHAMPRPTASSTTVAMISDCKVRSRPAVRLSWGTPSMTVQPDLSERLYSVTTSRLSTVRDSKVSSGCWRTLATTSGRGIRPRNCSISRLRATMRVAGSRMAARQLAGIFCSARMGLSAAGRTCAARMKRTAPSRSTGTATVMVAAPPAPRYMPDTSGCAVRTTCCSSSGWPGSSGPAAAAAVLSNWRRVAGSYSTISVMGRMACTLLAWRRNSCRSSSSRSSDTDKVRSAVMTVSKSRSTIDIIERAVAIASPSRLARSTR